MKKLIILLAALLLLLAGCTRSEKEPPVEGNKKCHGDRYLYYMHTYRTLARYDMESDEISPLCPDEACREDGSCVFSKIGIYGTDAARETILFQTLHDRSTPSNYVGDTLYCYRTETGELTEVLKCKDMTTPGFWGEYAYFCADTEPYVGNSLTESAERHDWKVFRYHIADRRLEQLSEQIPEVPLSLICATENTLLWLDGASIDCGYDRYIESDMNFQNLKHTSYDIMAGDLVYFFVYDKENRTNHFYREDTESGAVTRILADVETFLLDDLARPTEMYYVLQENRQEILHFDFATGETSLFYTVPEQYHALDFGGTTGNWFKHEKYLVVPVEGALYAPIYRGIILIDKKTGEGSLRAY